MALAIRLAVQNVDDGAGGPFGAVVAKGGETLAAAANRVTATNDPTAHAEVVAIREACARLGAFSLEGCVVYCSCEPCPMCLGALYWARPDAVFYAATAEDAAAAGFDDAHIYRELVLPKPDRALPLRRLHAEEAQEPFRRWGELPARVEY